MTAYLKPTGSPIPSQSPLQNVNTIADEIEKNTADFAIAFFVNLPQGGFEEPAPSGEILIDILTTSPGDLHLVEQAYDEGYLNHPEDALSEDEAGASMWEQESQEEGLFIHSFSLSASSSLPPCSTLRERTKIKLSRKKDYHLWSEEDFLRLETICKNKLYRTSQNKYAVKEISKLFNVSDRVCRNGITTLQRRGVLPKLHPKTFY